MDTYTKGTSKGATNNYILHDEHVTNTVVGYFQLEFLSNVMIAQNFLTLTLTCDISQHAGVNFGVTKIVVLTILKFKTITKKSMLNT